MSEKKPQEIVKTKKDHIVVETFLTFFIELISFSDFLTDGLILFELGESKSTLMFSISLFTMLCPYYTAYTTLMNF